MLHRLKMTKAARLVDRTISLEGAWWYTDRKWKPNTMTGSKTTYVFLCPGQYASREAINGGSHWAINPRA